MEVNKQEAGQRIKEVRQMLNLSMDKFGKLLGGLPRSTVNNWERGINLPKLETLNRIAEVGNVTNEYILYGNQEDEYIANLLRKKASEVDPKMTKVLTDFVKKTELEDNQELNRIVTFFAENLTPPTEKDYFYYHLIDEEKNLYLASSNFGKIAKFYLHYDVINEMIHIMPFTFAEQSISRLFIFLTNLESIKYFSKNLEAEMRGKSVVLYSLNEEKQELSLYPLTFSESSQIYQFEEQNFEKVEGKLYLPFIEEIAKLRIFNQSLEA